MLVDFWCLLKYLLKKYSGHKDITELKETLQDPYSHWVLMVYILSFSTYSMLEKLTIIGFEWF